MYSTQLPWVSVSPTVKTMGLTTFNQLLPGTSSSESRKRGARSSEQGNLRRRNDIYTRNFDFHRRQQCALTCLGTSKWKLELRNWENSSVGQEARSGLCQSGAHLRKQSEKDLRQLWSRGRSAPSPAPSCDVHSGRKSWFQRRLWQQCHHHLPTGRSSVSQKPLLFSLSWLHFWRVNVSCIKEDYRNPMNPTESPKSNGKENKQNAHGLFSAPSTQILCCKVNHGLFLSCLKMGGQLLPEGADVGTPMTDDVRPLLSGAIHLPSLMLSRDGVFSHRAGKEEGWGSCPGSQIRPSQRERTFPHVVPILSCGI